MSGGTVVQVDIGAVIVSEANTILTAPKVGSSVVLLAYDPESRKGGIANIALPDSAMSAQVGGGLPIQIDPEASKLKYANEAVPYLWEALQEVGCKKLTTRFKMIGGAQMFNFGGKGGNLLNIGARNAIAIRAALSKLGFAIEKADIGGNKVRDVSLNLISGEVLIQIVGGAQSSF
jgi:chemotaxis protein CheD